MLKLAAVFLPLALLLLITAGCANLPVAGGAFGACSYNGEEFTHVVNVEAKFWTGSGYTEPMVKPSLDLQRAPRSTSFGGEKFYLCVISKDDWPELRDMQSSRDFRPWDSVTPFTPRGQELDFGGYDIDHWMVLAFWE